MVVVYVQINQGAAWRSTNQSVVAQVPGLYYVYLNCFQMSVSFQVRLLLNDQPLSSLQQEYGQSGPTHSRATLVRLATGDKLNLMLPTNYSLTITSKVTFSGVRLYP